MISPWFITKILIRIFDRRQAMSDDEASPSLHQCCHSLLDEGFRSGIHRAGRFIQDHDRCIRQKRPGDGKQLFLTLGDIVCFLG